MRRGECHKQGSETDKGRREHGRSLASCLVSQCASDDTTKETAEAIDRHDQRELIHLRDVAGRSAGDRECEGGRELVVQ